MHSTGSYEESYSCSKYMFYYFKEIIHALCIPNDWQAFIKHIPWFRVQGDGVSYQTEYQLSNYKESRYYL